MTDLDVHLSAVVAGDASAFAQWLAGSEPPIRDSLRSFAAVVDVEVIVQETLLRVWQVAPRFERDGRPNGLLRFAIRIARNLAVSEVRRTRAEPVQQAAPIAPMKTRRATAWLAILAAVIALIAALVWWLLA